MYVQLRVAELDRPLVLSFQQCVFAKSQQHREGGI